MSWGYANTLSPCRWSGSNSRDAKAPNLLDHGGLKHVSIVSSATVFV